MVGLLGGHSIGLSDIDSNRGLGEVTKVSLVDLGIDEERGGLALATRSNSTIQLGESAILETPKNSGPNGDGLDIGIESLQILEAEGLVEDQLQRHGRPTNLGGDLGGGGGDVRVSIDVVHDKINLPEFGADSSSFFEFFEIGLRKVGKHFYK